MAYKKTKTVEKIEQDIDRYLDYMRMGGKTPSNLYLTTKQHDTLLADKNKSDANIDPRHKDIKALETFRGLTVKIYNP